MKKQFERLQVGWGFWLKWVLASTLGVPLGLASAAVVGSIAGIVFEAVFGYVLEDGAWSAVVIWTIVGTVIGAFQWLVLRRKVSQAGWWVLAGTVGWALGVVVARSWFKAVFGTDLLSFHAPIGYHPVVVFVGIIVSMAIVGAVTGVCHWLVLRRKVSQAGWWVLASTIGWPLSFVVGVGALEFLGEVEGVADGLNWTILEAAVVFVFLPVSVAVSVALPSCITGSVLVWLLRLHRQDEAGAIEVV